ncbi:hypothetical protein Tco_0682402 [Tanacetum coccineum]|uniref:Reverse transcriptase domain-containing protein n=1 Tax=Tanacetum coccineum TaxID=301880 RepID=A0ABQ4XS44_9ASTR
MPYLINCKELHMPQRRWIELFSDYECEIRYHPSKANMVADALSRKERVKPRHVRTMAMTIQSGVKEMILATQSEAFKQENILAERLHGLDQQMESRKDGRMKKDIATYVSKCLTCSKVKAEHQRPSDGTESVWDKSRLEYCLSSSDGWTKCAYNLDFGGYVKGVRNRFWWSPMLWAEIGEGSLIGPELVLETTDKVVLIKEKLKAVRDRQKSYVDKRRKPLEFECLADANLHVPLNEIKVDKTLRFVEEPVKIMDREIKKLKRRKIALCES